LRRYLVSPPHQARDFKHTSAASALYIRLARQRHALLRPFAFSPQRLYFGASFALGVRYRDMRTRPL